MGWSIGFDPNWHRDIGYGVPATCDHPGCGEHINRGLAYVCGAEPWGGEDGCGLFFCSAHLGFNSDDRQPVCERCAAHAEPFEPTPDTPEWTSWKLSDDSWAEWRAANPEAVLSLIEAARQASPNPDEGEFASPSGGPTNPLNERD